MTANSTSTNLDARDSSRGESLKSADAWLPEGERSGARGRARKNGSKQATRRQDGPQQWVVQPNGSSEVPPAPPREGPGPKPESSHHAAGRSANGGPADSGVELSALEELAEMQKVEISVLARRVAELESEITAARKEAASAKRQATRAKNAAKRPRSSRRSPRSS